LLAIEFTDSVRSFHTPLTSRTCERPAVDVQPNGLQQVALRDRGDGARHLGRRPHEVVDERVDGGFHFPPCSRGATDVQALFDAPLFAHGVADTLELGRHAFVGGDDGIEGVGDLAWDTCPMARKADGKVAVVDGLHDAEDFMQVTRRHLA
jgi:hypothetical protein